MIIWRNINLKHRDSLGNEEHLFKIVKHGLIGVSDLIELSEGDSYEITKIEDEGEKEQNVTVCRFP